MLTCKTIDCSSKGVEHSVPEFGDLYCGLCGQVMTENE